MMVEHLSYGHVGNDMFFRTDCSMCEYLQPRRGIVSKSTRFVPQEGRGVAVAKVLRFVVGILDALGVIVASMPVGACRCGGIGSFLEGTCSNHCRDLSPPRTTK